MTEWEHPAAWYDLMNPWGRDDEFYLRLVMSADRVLDVGCGTGRLLHRARAAGHSGRLCGLDPDPMMLGQARVRSDIEWVLADAASAASGRERGFDLAVMTGHAFQALISDEEVRSGLKGISGALAEAGRFAFHTRHPQARAWDGWNTSVQVAGPGGAVARVSYRVHEVAGDVVRLSETYEGPWWDRPLAEHGALRFLGPSRLAEFLREAGLTVERQFGGWDEGPLTDASDEIITIARRAEPGGTG
ncbi:MAG TPA: methyltransferase domain-containing protein [Streptosporangiaceae bacterium]|nr:methyltransferase domain-containing protein [Streptosporangiaceae bacterium]